MSRNFPDFIKGFVDLYVPQNCPEDLLSWSAISIIAATLENKVYIKSSGDITYPNMYILLIGPSGAGKTKSTSRAINIASHVIEHSTFLPTQSTGPALIEALSLIGREKQILMENSMQNTCAGYIYSAEASSFLTKSYKEDTMVTLLTHLWDNPPHWSKSTLSRGSVVLPHPMLNMLAGATTDWPQKNFTRAELLSGFAGRIIFVNTKASPQPGYFSDDKEDEAGLLTPDTETRKLLIADLKEIKETRGRFAPAPCFAPAYDKLVNIKEQMRKERENDILAGYWQRRMHHLTKLAQVLAVSDNSHPKIFAHHLERADALLLEVEKRMDAIFTGVGNNEYASDMQQVWDFIRERGEVGISAIAQKFRNDISMRQLGDVLKHLATMKRIIQPIIGSTVYCVAVGDEPLSTHIDMATLELRSLEAVSRKKTECQERGLSLKW